MAREAREDRQAVGNTISWTYYLYPSPTERPIKQGVFFLKLSREVFFLALLRVANQIGRGRERGHSPLLVVLRPQTSISP